jgi:multidrug transporter EmrE-like cation transporter
LRDLVVESRFFPLLAALSLLVFLVYPLADTYGDPGILLNIFTFTMFVVSLRAMSNSRRMVRMILLIALPMFGVRIWALFSDASVVMIAYAVLHGVFLGAVLLACLSRVLDRSPVNQDKILGAICVYVLIAIIFSFVYEVIYILDSNAIHLGVIHGDATTPQQFWVFTYFSFVTLTTLGYGDVFPITPVARSMATLEAVLGSLYLAILVARLVSLTDAVPTRHDRGAHTQDSVDT